MTWFQSTELQDSRAVIGWIYRHQLSGREFYISACSIDFQWVHLTEVDGSGFYECHIRELGASRLQFLRLAKNTMPASLKIVRDSSGEFPVERKWWIIDEEKTQGDVDVKRYQTQPTS